MVYEDLTPRQLSVLNFIIEYQSLHAIAPTVREIAAHLGLRSPGGIHRVLNILRERGYIESEGSKKRTWRFCGKLPGRGIPLIGDIAAGAPMEAIAHARDTIAIAPELFGRGNHFALKVHGDSMIEAHILDGDIAVIRSQSRVEQGRIAAVMIRDLLSEVTLKIIRRKQNTLILERPTVLINRWRSRAINASKSSLWASWPA